MSSRRGPGCWRLGLACALALAVAAPALAQLTRGTVSGTVTDGTGGVLPGVTVSIVNNATGIVRTLVTDAHGFYRAPALEPGTYTVRAELQGFKPVENTAVPVQPSSEATFDIGLEVGGLSETIDVTAKAEAVTLNRTNATVGVTATARQVVELPLSAARTVTNVALLSPNVSRAEGQTNIAANGQRSRNNNFMVDGTDNNDVSVTLATVPVVPESVAELSVQTNPYNVEFGRNSGAQVNVITKSGTNQIHGDVFEYFRDSKLNAMDNLEKASGRTSPTPFRRHQFGGGAGGPIVRSKAFYYGLVQRDRLQQEVLGNTTRIPTQAGFAALRTVPLRAGQSAASRQAVLDRLGFLQQIHQQGLTYRNAQNVLVNGVPIETAQINVMRPNPQFVWYYIGRGDVQLSNDDTVSARYIRNKPEITNQTSNTNFGSIFAANQVTIDENLAVSHTRVLGARTLNELRFARIKRDLSFPENDPNSPTATISGLFTIGGNSNFPQGRVQSTYQFQDIATLQRDRHSIKAGADLRYIKLDNLAAFDTKGTFTFNNLQDYMNNVAVTFVQALQTSSFLATQWTHAYFLQDDWRPSPNLTVNLGLRYEYNTVPLGLFGATEPEVRAALVPGPAQPDKNNLAPRVGFAFSPSPRGGFAKTLLGDGSSSFRGGWGRGFDVLFYNILTVNGSNYPRVVTGRADNATDVYPNITSVAGAATFSPLATFVNSPEDTQSPQSDFWSFSWQRETGRHYVLEAGYTGSRGRYGVAQGQANYGVLTQAQAATVQRTLSTTSIPTVQQRRLFPQFGSRVLIQATAKSSYHGIYGAISRRLDNGLGFGGSYTWSRMYSDGDESLALTFTTASPQIPQDFADMTTEWSPSSFDRPHRVVFHWMYEIPGFKQSHPVVRQVLGGWQVSGVFQAQSGQPFTIVTGVDTNGNGSGGDRPNVGPGTLVKDPLTNTYRSFTNNGAYVAPLGTNGLPLAFSLGNGNAPRNALRGPGFFNWDISLSKRFTTFHGQSFAFRVDFLNAFNQDEYKTPVSNMNSPDFGKNTQNWGNRSITAGLRYSF